MGMLMVQDYVDVQRQTGEAGMKLTPVGIDIAKTIFQVHYVDEDTGEIVSKPIKRAASVVACLARQNGAPLSLHYARKGTFASPLLA
ncbi:hypothetical protein OKW30_006090 [Paraburkholderia sp. Clong3]